MTQRETTQHGMKRAVLIGILLATLAPGVSAHEVRPAYLELRQTGPDTYDVLWKVPGQGENLRLGLYVELPQGCTNITPPRAAMVNSAFTERWTVKCAARLIGGTIHIAGLMTTMTDVLVRLERLDGSTQVTRLTPSAPSFVVAAAPRVMQVAATYLALGVEHILLGIDHLLFVLALLFLVGFNRQLLFTITAFTLAHSLTLALSALGLLTLRSPPVEATIALSIVLVAAEALHGGKTLARRWPALVAFLFGLVHGLGFAGALQEIGLPQKHLAVALLTFNVGVELGQLFVVALAFGVYRALSRWPQAVMARAPALYAIGTIAAYWSFGRIVGIIG